MVLRFVFFPARISVYLYVSFCILYFILFHGPIKKKKNYLEGRSDQFHSQKKQNGGEIPIPLTLPAEFSRRCV